MKKILALILSIVLVLGVALPALAADWTDGPTFALTADAKPDDDGCIKVTLELKGKDEDLLGAVTLNLVYDDAKVEPDTSKGTFKKSGKTFGIDLPECINSFSSKLVTPANTKTVSGESRKVFTVACTTDEDPSEGVGASSKINFYFKVKEGAEGPAVFTLATDTNVNFKVTDISGDNNAIRPAEGSLTATCNIPKSPVNISVDAIPNQEYTGSAIEPVLVVKVGETALTLGADYSVTYQNNVAVGKAAAIVKPEGGNTWANANDGDNFKVEFNIVPTMVDVIWENLTVDYNGKEHTPIAKYGEVAQTVTVENGPAVDAGTYTVKAASVEPNNYSVRNDTETLTINPVPYPGGDLTAEAVVPMDGVSGKTVTVTLPAGFKEETQNGDATVTGIVTSASYAKGSITLSTKAAENEGDTGTGTATLTLSSKNYNDVTLILTVTAKKVEAEWTAEPTGKDIVYGQTNAAAVASKGTATVTDPEGNAVAATIEVADAETIQSAGDHNVTVNVVTAEYGVVLSKTLTVKIAPAPATVTWSNTKFEYTGAAFKPTATVTGGVNGETLSVEVSGEQTNTGTHTATATLSVEGGNADPANYEMDKPSCEFEITGKKITFVVALTPDTFDENGSLQQPTVTVTAKEDVTLTAEDYVVVIPESIEAGTYTVTVNAKEGSPYFGSKEVTAQYKICGKPSFKSLKLTDGHTALTARYDFDANGYEITKYEVSVWLIEKNEDETETKTELEGSPFDAGTSANYTVSKLVVGNTYEVVVKATNEKGEAVSTAERVTLTKAPVVSGPTDPTYAITITSAENGKVTANVTSAAAGAEVKLTVKPAEGYELAKLTVTASDGTEIVLSGSDNEYSFMMPKSTVKVAASFQALAVEPSIVFEDVLESDYFFDSVYWAVDQEITKGKTETLFAPLDNATRAEVVTFLWRQAGQPEPLNTASAFEDVAEDAYYFKAVLWAYEMGIVLGKSETSFAPADLITRGQFVTMLYRMSNAEPVEAENPFTDVEADAYYAEAVLWAAANGITKGMTETEFMPDAACNRAQVVEFLYRFFK